MEKNLDRPFALPKHFDNAFWKFIIGQNKPELKTFFDNLKNYAVLSSLIFAAKILVKNDMLFTSYLVWVIAGLLAFFNFLQTLATFVVAFHWQVGFTVNDYLGHNGYKTAIKTWIIFGVPIILLYVVWQLGSVLAGSYELCIKN